MSHTLIGGPIAVVDVETTGLFPLLHDRVVEVAVVVLGRDGHIEREFESLVNPARDIGPSSIHRLTSEDILNAPKFGEIASLVLDILRGVVAIAAHNLRFDRQFLTREFERMGCQLPDCFGICTMELAGGGKLGDCCRDHGVLLEGNAHSALTDARAAAKLLTCLLSDHPRAVQNLRQLAPIQWPTIPATGRQSLTRDQTRRRQSEPSTFLQRILERRHDHALPEATDGAVIAYGALLDRALEDRRVDESEAEALVQMATTWGLSGEQVTDAHRHYLNQLAIAALADGRITDTEQRDLKLVARLLGQPEHELNEMLKEATSRLSNTLHKSMKDVPGKGRLEGMRVCFTGELQCQLAGRPISREMAEELATKAGLNVVDSVTKSCDLLVLADPHTQSGKANKARRYGIRIMHEPVFWNAIGIQL